MKTADKIRQAIAARWGYQTQGAGFDKVHHSLTLRDALEWASCYRLALVTKRGQFVALKQNY